MFDSARTSWVLFLVVCLHGSALALAQDAQVVEALRLGAGAMHEGKPEEAERYFRQVITTAPQLPVGYLDLGLALLKEGKPADAVESLRHSLALDPSQRGVHLFLGITSYQLNKLDDARTALKEELQQDATNTEALTWLGIVELGAGNADAAVGPLDEAARLSPKDVDILDYRAKAHSQVAAESYARMQQIDPDSWHVHRALAQNFADLGKTPEAIGEYRVAIEKQPGNPDLYEALGNLYQQVSQFDDAIHAYEQEVKLSPNNAIALYNLGKIDVERGDPAAGVALLRKAAPLLAHPAPGYFYLGLGLVKLNQNEEAVNWLEKSLASAPSDFVKRSAYFQLARVYQRLHRQADADKALANLKAMKVSEQNPAQP